MSAPGLFASLLALLILCHGTPVVLAWLLRRRWAWPLDGGRRAWDGRPWLGASKTWRGLAGALVVVSLGSFLLGLGMVFGLLFGLAGMLGDLLSSFIKRRRGLASSARAPGLDQIPESLLPALLALAWLDLPPWWLAALPLVFMLLNMGLSPLFFRLGVRRRPH